MCVLYGETISAQDTVVITAIFFDFDGVLTTDASGIEPMAAAICNAMPDLDKQRLIDCYLPFADALDLGHCRHADIWEKCCACIGATIELPLLYRALCAVTLNKRMFDLARSLKESYTVGIITDNDLDRFELLRKQFDLPSLFHPIIVSAEVGNVKASGSTEIFLAALKAAGCAPEEAIFIDNKQKNLVAPAKMGMKTYWHDDAKNDVDALIRQLLQWNIKT